MEESVRYYFIKGLANSTQRTYKSGKDRYITFCTNARIAALPVSQVGLSSFVAYLADQGLKHRTIKVYLSAVRHLQISAAQPDPFSGKSMPQLEYVLRGIKKREAEKAGSVRERLPITPAILLRMKAVWDPSGAQRDTKMIWAACCLCFFAFLRVGKMTAPGIRSYDAEVHLSVSDIAVDDPRRPSFFRIRIKQSKTDPFRKGVDLYVGRTYSTLCPVAAMLDYLSARGMAPGPLFTYQNGQYLTRQRFAGAVRTALTKAGIDQSKYCTHSFRIGAATTAAHKGVEDSVIKTLGRWESLAYLQYVKIPKKQLVSYSGRLVN